MIRLDWTTMKSFINTGQVFFKFVEDSSKIEIYGYDKEFRVITSIPKDGGADQTDFDNNFRSKANLPVRSKLISTNFTASRTGTVFDISSTPMKWFALQVIANGAVTSWDVRLFANPSDGTGLTSALQHTNTTGSGVSVYATTPIPSRFIAARCAGLVLGLGTSIDVHILGME